MSDASTRYGDDRPQLLCAGQNGVGSSLLVHPLFKQVVAEGKILQFGANST
jgi:hypothetical protein